MILCIFKYSLHIFLSDQLDQVLLLGEIKDKGKKKS